MRKKSLGESFLGSHNSLNFLRLALATVVVVTHAVALGGFGLGWITDNATPTERWLSMGSSESAAI